jgi:hypothetical protein
MCRMMWPSFHWGPKPVTLSTKLKPNPITLTPKPTTTQTNHMTPYWEGTKWQAKEGNSTHHSQNRLSPCGTHLKKLWRRSPCPSILPYSCTCEQDDGDLALPKPPPHPPAFFCCAFHVKGRDSLHALAAASARPRQSPSCETPFHDYLHMRITRQLTPLEVTDATPIAADMITSARKATWERERERQRYAEGSGVAHSPVWIEEMQSWPLISQIMAVETPRVGRVGGIPKTLMVGN